jgi:hypothetical protein
MRWWACDEGHSNSLRTNRTTGITWDTCLQCKPCLDRYYRIEIDVDEDDPDRLVPPPEPDHQSHTTKETHP